jgi:hypothetical protein
MGQRDMCGFPALAAKTGRFLAHSAKHEKRHSISALNGLFKRIIFIVQLKSLIFRLSICPK